MAKCLCTGGSGFIGSHIVDKLIELGHEVVIIDNESSEVHEHFYYNPKATYHKLDVADYTGIRPLFEGVDYVFHLAAESRIQPTIDNPLLCFNTNIYGTAAVLQAAREAGCKKVIYSSTSSTYGLKNKPPLQEDMSDDCLNPYSVSKLSGEKMCRIYTDLFGLKTIVFRYFNVYGPREPAKGQYAPIVGLFIRQKKADDPLTIVGDGLQRRDFTHVDDVVEANIRAMSYDGEHGQIFNVGTGRNHSIMELAKLVSIVGNGYDGSEKARIKFLAPRPGEARETLADTTKIMREFGWKPSKRIEDYVYKILKVVD